MELYQKLIIKIYDLLEDFIESITIVKGKRLKYVLYLSIFYLITLTVSYIMKAVSSTYPLISLIGTIIFGIMYAMDKIR